MEETNSWNLGEYDGVLCLSRVSREFLEYTLADHCHLSSGWDGIHISCILTFNGYDSFVA